MTPEELIAECERKQTVSGRKDVGVYLTAPYRKVSRYGNKIRLFGKDGGPLGELLNVTEDSLVGVFPADKVIRFAQKQLSSPS